MNQNLKDILDFLSTLGVLGTAVGAIIFGLKQTQINKRLNELQDYVAISIVPFFDGNDPKLQVVNAGKVNLYLKKYEIGNLTDTFTIEKLIACGSGNPFYILPVPNNIIGRELGVKLYLYDEFGNKYISTGGLVIDSFPVAGQQQIPAVITANQPQPLAQMILRTNIRGWSYKTEKYNWEI